MRNFKMVIEYDGTGYSGWQRQPNDRSVQEVLENAIRAVTGESVRVTGAGRTDAGVHALAQVANFTTSSELQAPELQPAINANLPDDVSVLDLREAAADFHAQRSARGKTYTYTILNRRVPSPLLRRAALFIPQKLDVDAMRRAAQFIRGEHDFACFRSAGSSAKTSTRNITRLDLEQKGDTTAITISADGFLYNMARAIVGTLIEVGRGKIAPDEIKDVISSKDRGRAGPTAPPHGLCLVKVDY
jgi:tRNA pseudouridine38-40 synthase